MTGSLDGSAEGRKLGVVVLLGSSLGDNDKLGEAVRRTGGRTVHSFSIEDLSVSYRYPQ